MEDGKNSLDEFPIRPHFNLDFLLAREGEWAVGTEHRAPPELKRRVLAAAISYKSRLSSLDYTRRRYVDDSLFDGERERVGDRISWYIDDVCRVLSGRLADLHTRDGITFGQFGAEFTLFKFPSTMNIARRLSDGGFALEAYSILRMILEMIAWSSVAFFENVEHRVVGLKASSCISELKKFYPNVGDLYGYLSSFAHWGHRTHSHFLEALENGVGVISASNVLRDRSLMVCLLIIDVFDVVVGRIYGQAANKIHGLIYETETNSEGHECFSIRKNFLCAKEICAALNDAECRQLAGWFQNTAP